MSMVQQAIEVSAPLHAVYERLAAFENYPQFMSGVRQVTPIGDNQTHWIMEVDGRRREFDAHFVERSVDERVSWATTDGPLLAETITLRPMGETKTQVVAQLEADLGFLAPSDRHGQASLSRRLQHDLRTLKALVEGGGVPTPATIAGRIRNRPPAAEAGWGRSAADRVGGDAVLPYLEPTSPPPATTVDSGWERDDVSRPRHRIGGGAGTAHIGGSTTQPWGDSAVNEEERGSAHDM